jgi:spore maturation protein CgeB
MATHHIRKNPARSSAAIRRGPSRSMIAGQRSGAQDGWLRGHQQGYRMGRADVIRDRSGYAPAVRPFRVLYVCSDIVLPHSPIDEAVIDTLKGLVSEVRTIYPMDDLCAAAEEFQPDIALFLHGYRVVPEQMAALRAKGWRTAIWFTDDPYHTDWSVPLAPLFDYVFTIESSCVPIYVAAGCERVAHLPLGVHPQAFAPRPADAEHESDICFIGTAFENRLRFFDEIAPYLASKRTRIIGIRWEALTSYSLLESAIRNDMWLSPEETAHYYNGAKIVLNLHRAADAAGNQNMRNIPALSVNPRMFEISGCAAFQLSDYREGLGAMYAPGAELNVFESTGDIIEKLEYYLQNEEARLEAALRGYERTLKEHTYAHRLDRMLSVIFA